MKEANALSFDKSRLELFDLLVVPEEEDRVQAACDLANHCTEDQRDHEESLRAMLKQGKVVKREEEVCSLATYSCKRLIRGMSSGRGSARQGFGLGLCEVLKAVEKLDTKFVLEIMEKSLVIDGPGKPKGGEIRETLLGRVFVYASLLKAGRLGTLKLKAGAITGLLEISTRKDYLSEVSYGVVQEILRATSMKDFKILCGMAPKLTEALEPQDVGDCQIEQLQLALWIWREHGKQAAVADGEGKGFPFLRQDYDVKEVFDETFLASIRPSLLRATTTHPRLHSVWYDLLGLLVPAFKKPREGEDAEAEIAERDDASNDLQSFWTTIVDEGLLQSSSERKFLAMELLKRMSPLLAAGDLQIVLSDPMMVCLKQNLKRQENYLHTSAKKCVRYLYSLMKRDTLSLEAKSLLSISLKQFGSWVKGADVAFEAAAEGDAIRDQFKIFREMFYGSLVGLAQGEDYDAHLLKRQKEILNQICTVCKSPNVTEDIAEDALRFLSAHAFFEFSGRNCHKVLDLPEENRDEIAGNARALPLSLSQYCFDCLINVLASLYQRPKFTEAYEAVTEKVLAFRVKLGKSKEASDARKYTPSNLETVEVLLDSRKKIQAALKKCAKQGDKGEAQAAKLRSLLALSTHVLLVQLGEIEIDFGSHAKDLAEVLDQVLAPVAKGRATRKKRKAEEDVEGADQWNDVLLDLMLSLLSLPNQLIRKTVDSVFSAFIADVTMAGVKSLVEVLQQTISEEDEEGEEDEEDEMEEESSEGEEEDSDDDDDDEEIQASDAKVSSKDLEGMDVDGEEGDDEGSDSDMDDEAMFKLDSIIAAQFQLRRQMNKKRRQEDLLHFKFRVLRLIETYLGSGTLGGVLVCLSEVLGSVLEGGGGMEADVLKRLAGIMRGLGNKAAGEVEGETVEAAYEILQKSVNFVAHVGPKKRDRAPAVEAVAMYALKVLAHRKEDKISDVAKLYEVALERYFVHQKKCILKREFFTRSFQNLPNLGGELAPKLKGYSESARNAFLKKEAEALLSNKKKRRRKK